MAKPKNNIYDPIYISQRENITIEEAKVYIDEYKKNKATNRENFIKKYGEETGVQKYNEWIKKSLGKGHKLEGKYKSLYCKEFYIKNGYTYEEAVKLAKEAQYKNSSLHIEYYLNRGYNLEQAKKKIQKIHNKKKGKNYLFDYLKLQNPNMSMEDLLELQKFIKDSSSINKIGKEKYDIKCKKTRKTFEDSGKWVPLSEKTEYDAYKHLVTYYTNQNDLSLLENFDKRALAGVDGGYHLDHKFSISMGFIHNIPPELIGAIKNLEFIPWEINIKKQGKCSITKEELVNEN